MRGCVGTPKASQNEFWLRVSPQDFRTAVSLRIAFKELVPPRFICAMLALVGPLSLHRALEKGRAPL